jgi:glycosidase
MIYRLPLLYQMNARVVLRQLSTTLGRPATLDDIPGETFDQLASQGFDWLYLLGAWQTGTAARQMSLTNPGLNEEYRRTLADFTPKDVSGSCFAVTGYSPNSAMGGSASLQRLRERIGRRGIRLMLDFVPNHTAPDHPWVQQHPEYYIQGTPDDLARQPHNYTQIGSGAQARVFAFGRDPYFPGWADTLQLDYTNPQAAAAMQAELLRAAGACDGLRCDMAMLLLPDIFERTWGKPALPFWPQAITSVKSAFPTFVFMAEVYWNLEAALLDLGFDYTYDKRLYDHLRDGQAQAVRQHLSASPAYLERMVHFLENHDEQRAAAVFPPEMHPAAAVAAFFTPGVRFFHQGQLEGRKVRISVHLDRGPDEPVDPDLTRFYQDLLAVLRRPIFRDGEWQILQCLTTDTGLTHPAFLAYIWNSEDQRAVVVVNFSAQPARAQVKIVSPAYVQWAQLLPVPLDPSPIEQSSRESLEISLPAWGFWVAAAPR